jgi:hypothetical protein
MNRIAQSVLLGIGTLGLLAGILLISGREASARPGEQSDWRERELHGRELHGTWNVQVTQYNCQTEQPLGPAFASLLTFDEGGTSTETTENPVFAAGQRGPGHGIWQFEGKHTYKAKDTALILFTTPPSMTPMNPGFTFGSQTLTQTITFSNGPDEFTSDAAVEFADATGKIYRQGCAKATAQRYE